MSQAKSSSKKLMHAYPVKQFANKGKHAALALLYKTYTTEFYTQFRRRWNAVRHGQLEALEFFGSTKHIASALSQSYLQGCLAQVCGSLKSHVAALSQRITRYIQGSSLPTELKHQLNTLNRNYAWKQPGQFYYPAELPVVDDFGTEHRVPNTANRPVLVSPEACRQARQLFKQACRTVRFPDIRSPRLLLGSRTVKFALSDTSRHAGFDAWLKVSTLAKGKTVQVPIRLHDYVKQAPGTLANSVELMLRDNTLHFVLVKKSTAAEYKAYHFGKAEGLRTGAETVAFDIGVTTLLASSDGDCYGNYWLQRLKVYDKRLTELAANRQRLGLKVSSPRYKQLVQQLRGFIKTEIGRIVNAYVRSHPQLKQVVLEDLQFQSPALSRRLNRLIQRFGLGRLKSKFEEMSEVYGFKLAVVNPAYTSLTCRHCGWVSKANRTTQKRFNCELCHRHAHADAQASCNIRERFAEGWSGLKSKHSVLAQLRARFLKELAGKLRHGVIDKQHLIACLTAKKGLFRFVDNQAERVQLTVLLGHVAVPQLKAL